jgi:hypothetical protein
VLRNDVANRFLSFRTDTMDPAKLEQVLTRYLAYQRLRWVRSHLLPPFAVLLFACALTTILPAIPHVTLVAAAVVVGFMTVTVLLAEFRARRQLLRELRGAARPQSL